MFTVFYSFFFQLFIFSIHLHQHTPFRTLAKVDCLLITICLKPHASVVCGNQSNTQFFIHVAGMFFYRFLFNFNNNNNCSLKSLLYLILLGKCLKFLRQSRELTSFDVLLEDNLYNQRKRRVFLKEFSNFPLRKKGKTIKIP